MALAADPVAPFRVATRHTDAVDAETAPTVELGLAPEDHVTWTKTVPAGVADDRTVALAAERFSSVSR
jgi:hypothetical protein